jgi:hypothetical protein
MFFRKGGDLDAHIPYILLHHSGIMAEEKEDDPYA